MEVSISGAGKLPDREPVRRRMFGRTCHTDNAGVRGGIQMFLELSADLPFVGITLVKFRQQESGSDLHPKAGLAFP